MLLWKVHVYTSRAPSHSANQGSEAWRRQGGPEVQWVKKGGKLQYGYKRHYLAVEDTGLIVAVYTTAANMHDGQCMASCLDQVATACRKSHPGRKRVFSKERSAITAKRFMQRYPTQSLQKWAIVCLGKALQ